MANLSQNKIAVLLLGQYGIDPKEAILIFADMMQRQFMLRFDYFGVDTLAIRHKQKALALSSKDERRIILDECTQHLSRLNLS